MAQTLRYDILSAGFAHLPVMREALHESAWLRNFAGLKLSEPIPDETTILNFRRMLGEYDLAKDILKQVNALLVRKVLLLKRGSIVDASIIAAPSATKNADGERDPEMTNHAELRGSCVLDSRSFGRCFYNLSTRGRNRWNGSPLPYANNTPRLLSGFILNLDGHPCQT